MEERIGAGENWNPADKDQIFWDTDLALDVNLFAHSLEQGHQVQVKEAGSYLLVYNDVVNGSVVRANPRITLEVNDVEDVILQSF